MVICSGISLKLKKVRPNCSSFNPFPSLPSFAKDDRNQFHCLNIVLNKKNWTIIFEFQLMANGVTKPFISLQGFFRRILYTNGGPLCQKFLAETVKTGTKNRCVIEASHV